MTNAEAIETLRANYPDACFKQLREAVDVAIQALSTDVVPVVRCKDCKHRIVNEHFGEKGYMKLKAMCTLDTGDPFELGRDAYDDDWYCADGERKEVR